MYQVYRTRFFDFYAIPGNSDVTIPLFDTNVPAGFPSPAQDYFEERISLSDYLVPNPLSTFLVRAKGTSMEGARIFDQSLLIVDRSREPFPRSICLCILDGDFTVKRIRKEHGRLFLKPENPTYTEIEIKEGQEFYVWGVITKIINDPLW